MWFSCRIAAHRKHDVLVETRDAAGVKERRNHEDEWDGNLDRIVLRAAVNRNFLVVDGVAPKKFVAMPHALVLLVGIKSFNGKSKLQGCFGASFAHFYVDDIAVNAVPGLFAGQTSLAFHCRTP